MTGTRSRQSQQAFAAGSRSRKPKLLIVKQIKRANKSMKRAEGSMEHAVEFVLRSV